MVDLKKPDKNIVKSFLQILLPSAVSTNFWEVSVAQLGIWGRAVALPSGVHRGRPWKFWLFCILNSSKNCSCCSATTNGDNLSIFRWNNVYTFESLEVCVWDTKSVYQLQNSLGCGTATKLELWRTLEMSFLCSLAHLA